MARDYSKYNPENQEQQSSNWTPPRREVEMEQISRRLAVSSRVHPSYLLAAYDYLINDRDLEPQNVTSISDLIYKIICDYLNILMQEEDPVPDPDISLSFLIDQGWITAKNKENQNAFKKIRHIKGSMEEKVMSGRASLKEQYDYWKDRDSQKAEEVMQKIVEEGIRHLHESDEPEEKKFSASKNPKDEQVVTDNRSGLSKTKENMTEQERLQKQAEERDKQAPIAKPDFLEES